ncbi:pentapeptide repeat-containing protein [Streptomyces phaeochromogenes]|uniref:Pentapeptide repeat-containing protein n=1 Tax=Streptomyces phaeochromogenes TaxID=1923 RepID=A0ABZ1HQX5_STRPH|nr:pentapeptide repeat-containing protein [Streptomyces phaeochromogenes]WSD20985.1 pentapeptide repeat-containing protein [Streptomyces phaeochromogenes]
MNPASLVDWIESRDLPATALTVASAVLLADLVWAYLDRAQPNETNEDAVKAHTQRHRTRAIVGGIAGTIALTVLLVWGPWWVEGHHLRDKNHELVSSAGIIITGFRTMLIAIVAGGFTAAGLYFTREKHRLEREQFQHAQDQFAENQKQFETTLRETQARDERQAELTREGQVTGRYVEAIKLLASDKLSERLGAIFALERIMIDSSRDEPTILAVLAAYIRDLNRDEDSPVPADLQAALGALGRRPNSSYAVDLNGADLRSATLDGLNFEKANLRGACLDGASCGRADLAGASFTGASLQKAHMVGADLTAASFTGASMQDVDLAAADLSHATLTADLANANMRFAVLDGARFRRVEANAFRSPSFTAHRARLNGVDLFGTDLRSTKGLDIDDLTRARLYSNTRLPEGFKEDETLKDVIQELSVTDVAFSRIAHEAAERARQRSKSAADDDGGDAT